MLAEKLPIRLPFCNAWTQADPPRLTRLPQGAAASHYRTHAGAEVDLVIEMPDGEILAVEIKRTLSPKLTPGLIESMQTLGAKRGLMIIPEGEPYPLSKAVTATGLREFLESVGWVKCVSAGVVCQY